MMDRMRNMVGGGGDRGPSQMEQQMMEEGRKTREIGVGVKIGNNCKWKRREERWS